MSAIENKKTRKSFTKNPKYTRDLGIKLKNRRLDSGFTLLDMQTMTEITVKTCIDVEKGMASGIDYYIEYAKALDFKLPELFNIDIVYRPRNELPAEDLQRVSLAKKIRSLMVDTDIFKNETYVFTIKILLIERELVVDSNTLGSEISGILLLWVSDGFLTKRKVEENNNVYRLVDKDPV